MLFSLLLLLYLRPIPLSYYLIQDLSYTHKTTNLFLYYVTVLSLRALKKSSQLILTNAWYKNL